MILAFIAMISLSGIMLLLYCWEEGRGSYPDIAVRAYGHYGKNAVNITLVLAQVQIHFC